MGFAFAFGVLVRLLQRRKNGEHGGFFDGIAIAAATVIPLLMVSMPTMDGLLQRLMFLTAYLWYGKQVSSASIPGNGTPNIAPHGMPPGPG